jgi:sporulation protein YlmC with PRC-barrel domain
MPESNTVQSGATLYDSGGSKIGTVTDVVVDPNTLEPEWYDVKVGLMGGHHLVPAEKIRVQLGRCTVPYDKEKVKSAPATMAPPLGDEKESLRSHYQLV